MIKHNIVNGLSNNYNFFMVLFRKGIPIWVYLIIAITPMVLVIGVFVNGLIQIADYKEFIRDLDDSIVYSMDNNSLRAEINGFSTRISRNNADLIFQEIYSSDYIFIKEETAKPKNILLDFGNGDKLWIHYYNPESLIYQYLRSDGREKEYLTKKITRFITFERLISTDRGNTIW